MISKLIGVGFSAAALLGMFWAPATGDCRIMGRRNPITEQKEFYCPANITCDLGGQCLPNEVFVETQGGKDRYAFSCACVGEIGYPLPCNAIAQYHRWEIDGVTYEQLVWECDDPSAVLCEPGAEKCIPISNDGWIAVPFYLCDCP